jgi:Tfp pilus assembly protein PilF
MSRVKLIGSILLASFVVGGCGEYVTFSKDSRRRGVQYLESNQNEEAKGAFRDAVRQNPRDYQSYYYLGSIYEKESAFAPAVTNYRTSLSVQNVTSEGRADVAFKLKSIDGFARCLAKFDSNDSEINRLVDAANASTSGDEWLVLARTFVYRGDADSAIDAYAKAAQQAPRSEYIAKSQGLYLEQVGHKPLAEQALRRAYRLDPNDEEVNTALRRLGIIPGPALKEESELVRPTLPRGPIPDLITPDRQPVAPTPSPTPSPAD